jgi:Tol biopolymer transport system component
MIDEKNLLERALESFEPQPGLTHRIDRRREQKRRNRRMGAGALAVILALASFVSLTRAFRSGERPADEPTPRPTPASPGSLAYAADGDIFVAAWDGSNPVRIADGRPPTKCGTGSSYGSGEYFALGSIWSPDGRYLAYRHADCDGPRDAWWDVVISDRRGNVVTSFPSEGWGISWSPDASRVAVWDHWATTIGVYGLDGVRKTLLTLPFLIRAGESDPVWSPDGGSLLLGNFNIPLDGSTPRQVPWADQRFVSATYSPDGSRIAFANKKGLAIADADGSDPEEMFKGWTSAVAWSPTDDRVAFTSDHDTELRLLDLATGRVTLLTETEGSAVFLVVAGSMFEFSPDGDRILFSSTEAETGVGPSWKMSSLWSVNADGSHLQRLVARTALGDWFSLRPTG